MKTATIYQVANDPPADEIGERIRHWLMTGTSGEQFIDVIFAEMCNRLAEAGIPVARATLHILTQNPQWLGARLTWRRGLRSAEIATVGYEVVTSPHYVNSPFRLVANGAREVRVRLGQGTPAMVNQNLYEELRTEGLTDYVAWPIDHTLGKRHLVTFATDAPTGFSDHQVSVLAGLLPVLALVSEIRVKNRLARTLLETYVGPHASEQILDGATTRGSGVTLGAAILISDLRGFTCLSNRCPRDEVIDILNGYFDALSQPIEKNGGEILKFMGDGLLAVFPLSNPTACADLLRAVGEAQAAMVELNDRHKKVGRDHLSFGVGVHVGDVMYGNIGSRNRLDFTVIGPAVNIAARLENLTKQVGRPVLYSKAFVDLAGCADALDEVGSFPLKGIDDPITVFASAEAPRVPPLYTSSTTKPARTAAIG